MPTGQIAPQQAMQVNCQSGLKGQIHTPPGMSPVNPAVPDKTNYFGIDVLGKLVWKGWDQGREFTKNLVLKNLGLKTLKLKYKVPESRFFSTMYPKPIFLSAGASFTLPITFRPLESIAYDDKVVFTLKTGESFEIPLKAILPYTDISIPIDLDFKMCAVKDSLSITFSVYNTGDLDTMLQWEVKDPFTVEPAEAFLKHGSVAKFMATFRPEGGYVYEVTAVIKFGPELGMSRPTTFYGIGKFPHLIVTHPGTKSATSDNLNASREREINFGAVAVATSTVQWVELQNMSQVRTPFRVERIVGMSRMDTVFQCTQKQGIVAPMSLIRIPLTFTPQAVGATSIDYFSVVSVGDISRSVIKCVGTSVGPELELTSYSVNFMQIDEGRAGTQTLDVINNSDVEAVYQFELDCEESVFKFQSVSGVIKPNSSQTLILKFVPQYPINYYRRVACLVHNQPPLFLDLIGTCHSETVKPAILKCEHVSRYYTHVERGLSVIAPEQLNELLKSGRLVVDNNGCLEVTSEEDQAQLCPVPALRDLLSPDEYFNDGFHSDLMNFPPHVSTDANVLDFGNVQNFRIQEDRSVSITNHTKGKVTVQWISDGSHIFTVTPDTLDIPPLKACSFRVTFRATAPNQLFGNELECYVFYKSMRDYRLVEEKTQCPPWCLTVKCLGHTFMPNNETFLPRSAVVPSVVVFPAVNMGESGYRTVVMGNQGETPILYDMAESLKSQLPVRSRCGTNAATRAVFAVKPSKGILKCGYQIFTVRVTPSLVSAVQQDFTMRLNDNEKYDKVIHLSGSAECPEILLDNGGCLYIKPTCVGTQSTKVYGFKNVSRIPLRFQWKISHEDRKVLNVEPDSGVIQPNQSVTQIWHFIPREMQKYVMKASLDTWGQGLSPASSGGKKCQFTVRVVGEGSIGEMQTDCGHLDFGDIVVGSSASGRIDLYNNSTCCLHYRLLLDRESEVNECGWSGRDRPEVEFDQMEGVLPARSKQSVTATIRPMRRIHYKYAVSYQLVIPHGTVSHTSVTEPQHLVHLMASGVFPVMTVTDIRSQGSAVAISKKSLWNLFSLDNLNAYLDSDPSPEELMYSLATRHSTRKRPSVLTRAILDFNFSAAPIGSEPCTVSVVYENIGTVPCEWVFLFPRDIQMEMGYWTDSGDCDQDELHEMKVMDNQLFSVSPKRGVLRPGDQVTVTISYQHIMAGTHHLPVLLKLARGREISLNFVGVTVEKGLPYIHFPSNKHTFNPVPVGEKISPKQMYELYNGGAVPVVYECDLTPLDIIRQENFDQPIFECLNPTGQIQPGRSVYVEWRFFPLEAKTYMVDIPIRVHNGEMAVVTFTGIGFDKRVMGDTMPFSDQPDMCGVPSKQAADVPGQLGYLSMERISFGNMPLFSQVRRMLFISNKSKDRAIFFEWHVTAQADTQLLNIYPVRGKIAPNEYKMCRVTFLACGVPSFYDLDLVCEIADLQQHTEYMKQLEAWETERERQLNEFVVTEDDPHADLRTPHVVDIVDGSPAGRLSKLDALAEGRPTTADGELSKYKTLPPIRQLTEDEKREVERRKEKKRSQLWQRPEHQKPFLLHLGVTARTHDTRHFEANFPEEYYHFYIDRNLSEKRRLQPKRMEGVVPPTSVICTIGESNIVASVVGNCLRGLLDDTYFIQAVRKVLNEPIPYFRQFSEQNPCNTKVSQSGTKGNNPVESTLSLKESGDDVVDASTCNEESVTYGPFEVEGDDTHRNNSLQDLVSRPITPLYVQLVDEETNKLTADAAQLKEKQTLKKMPEFGASCEQLLENAVLNLMYEALSSEYSVVSKPRFVAMPKRISAPTTRNVHH